MTAGVASIEQPPAAAAEVFGSQLELASEYVRLLATTGVERGLIGPREGSRLWSRHVLNSAAISAWIPAQVEVTDLGSGAGLPGIPLALARPDLRITLVEPMARRIDFLDEVVARLGLTVSVQRARGEDLPRSSTDVVVARAVAPLIRLIPLALPLLRSPGRLVALKGSTAEAELSAAAHELAGWSGAHASVVRAAAGGEGVTAVMIVLGPDARYSPVARDSGAPRTGAPDGGGSSR